MPIFMDRHDANVQHEDIAELHRRDLAVQHRYNVNYLTYWFDPARAACFCLVDAPDAATAERVHREAHGEVAHAIIPVDLAAVEAFLGRISDARGVAGTASVADSGLRSIMFTDLVGSTEMIARLGDAAALELVRAHDALVRRGLEAYDGREVKHTGDGIMASFEKASDAVRAAADIQRRFAAFNEDAAETLSVRIGVHAGEPVEDGNDLFGSTVNFAARLCSEAGGGEIVVSDFVRELCAGDLAGFLPLGARRLKGFPGVIPVFRFDWRKSVGQEAHLSQPCPTPA
jgi:class 3 adenylate cyclase